MNKISSWAIIECTNCNQIFSTPSTMISEEGENYRYLLCPYCGTEGEIGKNMIFINHSNMNCDIKKVTKWLVE